MPEMGAPPNEETMHLLMSSYASKGDIVGTDTALRKYEELGFIPTTKTMNILLNSFLKSPDGVDFIVLLSCYTEFYGDGKLVPDSETYELLLKAAEKSGSSDDFFRIYDDMISKDCKILISHRKALKEV